MMKEIIEKSGWYCPCCSDLKYSYEMGKITKSDGEIVLACDNCGHSESW